MSRDRCSFEEKGKKIRREIVDASNYSKMGRRHISSPHPGGLVLNTVTPCAACKLLRRRCAEECPFSPYFSPHEPQRFAAVHKVFGASNVSKMLMEVAENQRADTANSLVYEANLRLRDPVYGCMGAISALQQQIQSLQAEINSVRAEIIKYKYREASNNSNNINIPCTPQAAILVSEILSSIAATPPPPPPLYPPPIVISSSSSSSISSLYTTPTTSLTGYSSISNVSVPYLD